MARLVAIAILLFLHECGIALTLEVFPEGTEEYPTIQAALDSANAGDTVLLYPGLYSGEGNRFLQFNGKDVVLKGLNGSDETTIDCELEESGVYFSGGETENARVEGLTILSGQGSSIEYGGAIMCNNASPTLVDLVIESSHSVSAGGGIYLWNSFARVERVTLRNNSAVIGGGGIYNSGGSPTIEDCSFIDNVAYSQGGGMRINRDCAPVIRNCLFQGCRANNEGGGIFLIGTGASIQQCEFTSNEADHGGGVYSAEAWPDLWDCVFFKNHARIYAGAVYFGYHSSSGPTRLRDSVVYANTAGSGGGGIICTEGSRPYIFKTTIVGNGGNTVNGAGITSFILANPTINDCIIAFNDGPGILVGGYADLDIFCSDVYGNTLGDYYGNILDQTDLNGNISEDPLFCGLPKHDFTLSVDSPCAPGNPSCGARMGALPVNCGTSTMESTWSVVKALF